MRKIILCVLPVILIIYVMTWAIESRAEDIPALLDLDSWSFSDKEIRDLNALTPSVLETKIISIMSGIRGYKERGKLMSFRVVDMNGDGIAEAVIRIDASGRGLSRDVTVLSRKTGQYIYEIVPSYGIGITLWKANNQELVVGSEPMFELIRADPILAFPQLYAWTGSKCEIVSKQHWNYYEEKFLPLLTNGLSRAHQASALQERDARHRAVIEAVQWAFATDKLNEMFPETPIVRDLMKNADDLMKVLRTEDDEELRDVQEKIRLQVRGEK